MATVDRGYAAALKAPQATRVVAANGWATANVITVPTPFATEAGAAAEGARVAEFMGGPLVRDRAVVAGERRDLARRCIRLSGGLDYRAAGELVFVIGVAEQTNGTSVLTVLRRLA